MHKRIGNQATQRELMSCFETGLQQRYGSTLGALYGEVVRYHAGSYLEIDELREALNTHAIPVLRAILEGKVIPATLLAVRSLMIGSALVDEREAVIRWAMEGLNRSRKFGGEWAQTEPQWQAVLENPDQFMFYTRQIKYFLMQI